MNEANRRAFLKVAGLSTAGACFPSVALSVGRASQVNIAQVAYPGGNWQPRPTSLRRLAWEIHKRTAIDTVLEPSVIKPTVSALAANPLVYLAGDRRFSRWETPAVTAMARFLKLGGTLIVDPAMNKNADPDGFDESVDRLLDAVLPDTEPIKIPSEHVLYRAFYQISRPVGRVEGPAFLWGYPINERLAVIRTEHDLGGAWARDNLGSWELEVTPGGERQRESAFRLGINLLFYALCQDYKDEKSHQRFGDQLVED